MRKQFALSTLTLFPLVLFAQGPALPQDQPLSSPVINDPDLITQQFQNLVPQWAAAIQPYAYEIFFALAGLELAMFGWYLWQHHHGDLSGAIIATTGKVLTISLFLTLLMNGGAWMGAIINGFTDVGKGATGLPGLGPSTIVSQGLKIGRHSLERSGKTGTAHARCSGLALVACGVIICLSFLAIALEFILCKVMAAITLSAGLLMLAFGASRWTATFVERYFSLAFSIGLRLLVLYLMVGAGWSLTDAWITQAAQAPKAGNSIELSMSIVCAALLYSLLVLRTPSIVSGVLSGAPSLSHGDVMGFVGPSYRRRFRAAWSWALSLRGRRQQAGPVKAEGRKQPRAIRRVATPRAKRRMFRHPERTEAYQQAAVDPNRGACRCRRWGCSPPARLYKPG